MPADITRQDLAKYQYDLVTNGLSAEQTQLLTELGLDAQGRAEVLNAMILAEFPGEALNQDPVTQFPDLLTDPRSCSELLKSLRTLLRAYAAGEGWKM